LAHSSSLSREQFEALKREVDKLLAERQVIMRKLEACEANHGGCATIGKTWKTP
jgi:DNA-nicking Smr family endonuclease